MVDWCAGVRVIGVIWFLQKLALIRPILSVSSVKRSAYFEYSGLWLARNVRKQAQIELLLIIVK
jgi:hypothetical protein